MMRSVLYVNTPTYLGGAEISLLTLMQHLDQARYRPHLLTSGEGPLSQRARDAGIPVSTQDWPWFSKRRFWRYPWSLYRLIRTIRSRRIALVHTNCDRALRRVMYASALTGVPYVSHVRDFVRSWFRPEKVVALNRAHWVIANSNATARACQDAGVHPHRLTVIYNPVDVSAFREVSPAARAAVRDELGLQADAFVVAIVGQIQEIKGHSALIEAAFHILPELPHARFLIVGGAHAERSQSFLSQLQQRVQASPYADHFLFTGFRDDIAAVMSAVDIVCMPSWTEPFGRVAVEAMAAGCAVVAADAGGLPEIVADGINGLLVPPRDVGALATAIQRLVASPALRRRLSTSGRRTVEEFTVAKHVAAVQNLYDAVFSGGSP